MDVDLSRSRFEPWLRALRLHQWAKNLLVFVPLLLSGGFLTADSLPRVALGFLLMGACVSGTYILNDISDIEADRAHATKRNRPFASGALGPMAGRAAAIPLVLISVGLAAILSPAFGGLLALYAVVTISYSIFLKRLAILDVGILASLYALRLVIGAELAGVMLSQWLAVFALTFFLSLSLAKRHTEIVNAERAGGGQIAGRGYRTQDAGLVLALGISSAMAALLVMVLFLVFQAFQQPNYVHPQFLWAAPFLTFFWVSRIWLFASRGELDDDPVAFALSDRVSLAMGGLVVAAALAAVLPIA